MSEHRKGFNFYKSYFDVYHELSDKEKIKFMDALLERQFWGVEPDKLTGMSKFAYISQRHNIDAQVKGFEDKTGKVLHPPTEPPPVGVKTPPSVQEEGKGKGKGKEEGKGEIPTEAVFIAYAVEQVKDIKTEAVRLKYRAWIESDWHTGGDKPKPIKNWKTTLLNTLPHMERNAAAKPFKYER